MSLDGSSVIDDKIVVPPDSNGKRVRALNYVLSGQNTASSVWAEVHHLADPLSGGYLALVNSSGALTVSSSGEAVSVSGDVVAQYASSPQSGAFVVVSGVGATSGQLNVASSGLGTVGVSSGGVLPVMAASLQSGGSVAVSGVGATSGALNVATSGMGSVAISSGGIIPISIISGNVVALSGIVEIVSGQTVIVVSSGIGTIAVSSGGVLPISLVSGSVAALSGLQGVSFSGALGATVSGGIQVSGTVAVSGPVPIYASSIQSGFLTALSGGIAGLSGLQTVPLLPAYQSGVLVGISGGGAGISGVAVSVSGNSISIVSGGGPIQVQTSGGASIVIAGSGQTPALISTVQAFDSSAVQSNASNGIQSNSVLFAIDGITTNSLIRAVRTVVGSSGGSLGVLAVQLVGYSYTLISGAGFVNAKSGAVFLHGININSYSSGGQFEIRDSASGITGTILGTISPTIGGLTNTDLPPASLIYDVLLVSGLVISTSGASWNLTALWRTATS